MVKRIKMGISSCLLGEKVRYDGQHKLDHYLKNVLGHHVQWVGVCPEVECGLPIPREAMHLIGNSDTPRLVTVRTNIDHTDKMQNWINQKLKKLEQYDLSGFVFKSKSPSSGLKNVKIYQDNGIPLKNGMGLFAKAFTEKFPYLPVEEEGRLHDAKLRENFLEQVFVYKRWQDYVADDNTFAGLEIFHRRHKYLLITHSESGYLELDEIIHEGRNMPLAEVQAKYLHKLMYTMSIHTSTTKNANVMHDVMDCFSNMLSHDEKLELIDQIDVYQKGYAPLIVPVVLLQHYVRKYNLSDLNEQYYLFQYPNELCLRNRV